MNSNEPCVSIGCYPEIDGETEIILGRIDDVGSSLQLAFDGVLETPNKTLIVSTVDDEILLQDEVDETATRVRVMVSHPRWPERVLIGWG